VIAQRDHLGIQIPDLGYMGLQLPSCRMQGCQVLE